MLKTSRLAIQLLWREWRAGEWFIVFFSLVLAIAAITSIHFYIDRLTRALDQQSAKFLGGNLVISSATPLPRAWITQAQTLELHTAEVWSYPSVVSANNQMQLVNVQAVSNSYPLLGDITIKRDLYTVLVEPRLLPLLSIHIHDSIILGAKTFQVSQLLTPDVDTLNTGFAIAPRMMLRLDDVPATRTVIPGSRVDYRLLLTGENKQLQQYVQWLTPRLNPGQRLINVHNQQFAVRDILSRSDNYIQLTLLVCLIMAGVAIALSIQQYLRRHYSHVALWRCLGAKRQQIIQIYLWQLFIIACAAGTLAVAIGFVMQEIFADLFKDFLQFSLPHVTAAPVVLGFVTSSFLLFAFAYPVISELPGISPLYIWRNETTNNAYQRNLYLAMALFCILTFIYWFMDFSLLTLWMIGILVLSVGFLYGLSRLLFVLLRIVFVKTEGVIRQGLRQLIQHSKSVSLQFIGFNLILISLLVLGLIRTDLVEKWEQSLPKHTPNYFAINIAASDLISLRQFFANHQIHVDGIYPMVRGRLIELNGKPIVTVIPKNVLTNNALHRELNLSWMWQFPADNKIISGSMWTPQTNDKPSVSVESNLANDLQLHLGDELTFQIGDQKRSAVIANFRTLDWASFHPNFYMIFSPGLFDQFAATYITSLHLAPAQSVLLNQLIQQFPNITVIDVASLLQQIQDLIYKVTSAMQYLFFYALGIGGLIFMASVQASMDERRQTYSLLRVLGADKKYIRKSLLVEFGCLGIVIVLTVVSIAYLIVFVLEKYVFNF